LAELSRASSSATRAARADVASLARAPVACADHPTRKRHGE
jgi:hypothetical protein